MNAAEEGTGEGNACRDQRRNEQHPLPGQLASDREGMQVDDRQHAEQAKEKREEGEEAPPVSTEAAVVDGVAVIRPPPRAGSGSRAGESG